MPQCSAFNCNKRGVHLFPKDPRRRKLWENALRIKNFKASNTARLCSAHFKEEDYFGRSNYTDNEPLANFLKKDVVPSIFCFTKKEPLTPAALARQQRYEKRSQRSLEDVASTPSTNLDVIMTPTYLPEESEVILIDDEASPTQNVESAPEHTSKSTQTDQEYFFGSINKFKDDDLAIFFYTGFETYKNFRFVFSTLSPMAEKINYHCGKVTLSTEDQFFLTMMKLRHNKSILELSRFFDLSDTTTYTIFITWINFMDQSWSRIRPDKKLILQYMPEHFKATNNNLVNEGESTLRNSKNNTAEQHSPNVSSWTTHRYASNVAKDGRIYSYRFLTDHGSINDKSTVEQSNSKNNCPNCQIRQDGQHVDKRVDLLASSISLRVVGLTKKYRILNCKLDNKYPLLGKKIFFVCFMCGNLENAIE